MTTRFKEIENFLTSLSLGLITDIDGTISPIAPTPEEARVSPQCRRCLKALAKRLPLVAVISGRPALEARKMVGVEGLVYVGNHGLERLVGGRKVVVGPGPDAKEYGEAIASALEALSRELNMEGIIMENKGITASIHYRLAPDHDAAREAILSQLQEILSPWPLRFTEGKMVVELRPQVLPLGRMDKGGAVLALLAEYNLEKAIYLGDDQTDVDAFLALRHWAAREGKEALAVAVLSLETPPEVVQKADLSLNGIEEVEEFLRWLAQSALADKAP